jgi:adenylosuccinate synthase
MSNAVIVGTQWGDEGKAKIIDYLAERSDIVIRFQGGANAGHTVIAHGKKFIFHLVPSGIMYPGKICVVGNGVVFDAEQFLREIDELTLFGISVEDRLFVSDAAHLVLPYHKTHDAARELSMGKGKIGTTGRGIGPAYADKVSRTGIRVGDLVDRNAFLEKLKVGFELHKSIVTSVYKSDFTLSFDAIAEKFSLIRELVLPYLKDTAHYLFNAKQEGKRLLFEGAQGTFLDIDHGTYPFVTSSNTISGCACTGSGLGPTSIDHVIGIVKAYTTRVGNGPFPTELNDETGESLRSIGGEFGATTGRPRRCGWFDSVMVRKSIELNGLTRLALTKLDVLNSFSEILICTHYEINGKKTAQYPSEVTKLDIVKPVYEAIPGWKCDISNCRSFDDLPSAAKIFIDRLCSFCYSIPILLVSVGPDRNQTIEVTPL